MSDVESLLSRLRGGYRSVTVHVTHGEARKAITEYIEIFYNRQRKQARLGYLSPAAFTQQFFKNQLAA
jgi:hypothetical protein